MENLSGVAGASWCSGRKLVQRAQAGEARFEGCSGRELGMQDLRGGLEGVAPESERLRGSAPESAQDQGIGGAALEYEGLGGAAPEARKYEGIGGSAPKIKELWAQRLKQENMKEFCDSSCMS